MSKANYDGHMNAREKTKRLAGFIVFALAVVFCFSISPLVFGCSIEDHYFTYTSDFIGPCGAYLGDSIQAVVKVSFWDTDVGKTVQAMAHVGTPCRLASGNPVYSSNYTVTSSDVGVVKTFSIDLTSLVTGDGPGTYTVADAGVLNVAAGGYICGATILEPSGCSLLGVEMRSSSVLVKVGTGGGRIDVERTAPTQAFLGSVTSTTGKIFDFNLNDTMKATAYPDIGNTFTNFKNLNTGEVSTGNPITWVITWAGMNTLTGNFTGDTDNPPSGERIGSSCTMVSYELFGQTWWKVVHDKGYSVCSGDPYDDAKYCGERTGACYDKSLLDFAFLINDSGADVSHNCFASSGDVIKTEILAKFYAPQIGIAVKAVSVIKFPDGSLHEYASASYTTSGSGIEMIQTTITRSDIVPSTQPYIFVKAKVVRASDNSTLFDSGTWAGGRCVVLNTNLPPTPMPGSSFIYPARDATGIPLTAALSWSPSVDPEGATVYYDVYFGTTNNPPVVASDQTATTYDPPEQLDINKTYYWHIVAKDATGASGATIRGPASGNWSFKTINGDQVQTATDGYSYAAYGNNYVAQSFKPSYNYGTFSVNVYAAKVGSPTEECGLEIWGDTNGLPDSGKFICFALQPNTKFGQEFAAWIEFMLIPYYPPDFIGLKYNTTYWAVFYQHNRSGDSSNLYYWLKYTGAAGSGGPYARGQAATSADGGASWVISADTDMTFFTFADRLLVPSAPTGLTVNGVIPSTDVNAPTVVTPSVNFNWNDNLSSEFVDWYNLHIDTTTYAQIPVSEKTLTLMSGYTYKCNVQAHNNAGVGPNSSPDEYIHTNTAPDVPTDNLATIVSTGVTLTWVGGEWDPGDTVTYVVYLGSAPNHLTASPSLSQAKYDVPLSQLTAGGAYYWYVLAIDNHGAQTRGPATGTWTFEYKTSNTLELYDAVTEYKAPVDIQAKLTRSASGAPLGNKTINFIIGYNERDKITPQERTAITDAVTGIATLNFIPSPFMKPGTYSLEAKFNGDADEGPATALPKTLTIIGKDTSINCVSETMTLGSINTIEARLVDSSGNGIDDQLVTFYVTDPEGHGPFVDDGFTGAGGYAHSGFDPSIPGIHNFRAEFATTADWNGSECTGTMTVIKDPDAPAPPNAPTNPSPPDGALKVGRYNQYSQLVVDLSWQCTDPNPDDILTYDVYLDKKIDATTQPTTKLNNNPLTTAFYTTGPLREGDTYVWKVIPKDDGGLTPTDPISVWSFTAGVEGNVGKVFYVSTVGYDGWSGRVRTPVESDGVFIDGPWATITKAAATMTAGATTVVLGGNYGAEHIVFANGGVDWSSAITLEAEGEVTIDGGGTGTGILINGKGYIIIQGSPKVTSSFNIYNYYTGISIANGTSITVNDCDLLTNGDGISLAATTYTNIHNNNIFGSNRTGVALDASSNNNSINGNNIYGSTTANVSDSGASNTWLKNYYGDYPDYTGPDLNADGFGDIAYTFTTGSDAQPLMDPIEVVNTREVLLQVAP